MRLVMIILRVKLALLFNDKYKQGYSYIMTQYTSTGTSQQGAIVVAVLDAISRNITYTVTGTTPCGSDTSDVLVTIYPQPTAGTGSTTTVCETSTAPINLFDLLTGEQTGGTWTRIPGGTG